MILECCSSYLIYEVKFCIPSAPLSKGGAFKVPLSKGDLGGLEIYFITVRIAIHFDYGLIKFGSDFLYLENILIGFNIK